MWWLLFLLCQVDVKTVTKNQELPVEVYGDRNQLTQTLDPGTTIVRTVEDSKASQQFPFLPSPFEFKYDGNERLTRVLFNGLPLYQFTYDGLLLESITVPGQSQGSSKRMKAPETISHDYDGEYRLSGLHSSTRGDLGQVSFSDDGRDRVERYTDPNGVTAQYAYTPEGWVQSIEIEDGPSFHYDYDAQGNLTGVEVDGLAASFNDYQDRVPETMDWLSDGDVLRTFSLTRTPEGKLDRIESNDGAYLLDLDWQQETPSDYPMVVRVERAGPGFGEVIVPRYVTVTTYDQDKRLDGITLTRSTGQVIEESYGISAKRLAGSLYRSVDGAPVLAWDKTMDVDAEAMRTSAVQDALTGESVAYVYDDFGNLETTSYSGGADWQYTFNAFRSLEEVQGPGSLITNGFDYRGRRVSSSAALSGRALYFYQGNQVIAIGVQGISGAITWTHAIGRGPMGPSFIKDLRGGQDQFIFTDHLGTPFAYESAAAGTVTYTPFNPWGELLAYDGSRPPPYAHGNVQALGFDLPVDAEFGLPPLGLSGHLRDASSGLIWMGVRAYEPRLGTFLTPDFRAPSFYDPTTYQEPYAFAAGNPLMFWDPSGLKEVPYRIGSTNYILDIDDEEWDQILHGQAAFSLFDPMGNGIRLFDPLRRVEPQWVVGLDQFDTRLMNASEYEPYMKELRKRESEQIAYIQSLMPRYAQTVFPWIKDQIIRDIRSVGPEGRNEIFRQLRDQGMLHLVNAENGFTFDEFWAAAMQLVGPQVIHYKRFGFWHDLEVASWLYGAGEFAVFTKGILRPSGSLLGRSFGDLVPETLVAQGRMIPAHFGVRSIGDDPNLLRMWQDSINHLYQSKRATAYRKYLDAIESGAVTPETARAAFDSVRKEFLKRVQASGREFPGFDFESLHHWNWPIGDNALDAVNPFNIFPVSTEKHLLIHQMLTSGPHPTSSPINPMHVIKLIQASVLSP